MPIKRRVLFWNAALGSIDKAFKYAQVQEADLTPLTFASHRITDGHLLMALYGRTQHLHRGHETLNLARQARCPWLEPCLHA